MTVIRCEMDRLGFSPVEIAKRGNLFTQQVYQARAGTFRFGKAAREKFARAIGRPIAELFDSHGWPLDVPPADRRA